MNDELIKVALFPIPGVVAFPSTTVPLHVFEPRYRQMVKDAIDQQRMIAVCHTKKVIRKAKDGQSVKDALSNNQATYEPFKIFSAGTCEVVDTTDDGRVFINILMKQRLKLVNELQTLPYRIVECTELQDSTTPVADEDLSLHQTSIVNAIASFIERHNPAKLSEFDKTAWCNLPASEFSFKVFQLVRFSPDIMQSILEATDKLDRLKMINTLVQPE